MRNPSSPHSSGKKCSSTARPSDHFTVLLPVQDLISKVSFPAQPDVENYFSSTNLDEVDVSLSNGRRKRNLLRLLDLFKEFDIRDALGFNTQDRHLDKNELCGKMLTKVLNMMDEEMSFEARQEVIQFLQELIAATCV